MNSTAIFCTSLIDRDPQRYQNWINYYSDFFSGLPVSLWMVNDGPVTTQLDLKNVELRSFDKHLGRPSVWVFPGWKRSFFHAIYWLDRECKFQRIAHIESDCWIPRSAKNEFLYYLDQEGYFTGYTPTYDFPEAALQIINSPAVRQYIIDKYSCMENWFEDIDFEKDLERLNPTYVLKGDRIEGQYERFNDSFTFVSGMTYGDFERLYGRSV